MIPLPIANILHHKLRSALAMLGVAIAVCMLVTLSGLSRGSLEENADRWQSVKADLIVYPATWGENITTVSGGGMGDSDIARITSLADEGRKVVQRVVPVFIYHLAIGKDSYNVVGVAPGDLGVLQGKGDVLPGGRVFDPANRFSDWLTQRLTSASGEIVDITPDDLAQHGGLEVVIDTRLAKVSHVKVGDKLYFAGHDFTVVGIVPDGSMARAFIPLATAEYLFNARLGRYTLLFVKLDPAVRVGKSIQAIRDTRHLTAVSVNEYGGMLRSQFGVMYLYVDAVNAITLIVAFLFILLTLYTMVIQRTREIAILKSMGAGRLYILRGVLTESLMLTLIGSAVGVAMSFGAGWAIQAFKPLLTVTITPYWIGIAALAAVVGGTASALYPAWCAMRVDVIEAINLE